MKEKRGGGAQTETVPNPLVFFEKGNQKCWNSELRKPERKGDRGAPGTQEEEKNRGGEEHKRRRGLRDVERGSKSELPKRRSRFEESKGVDTGVGCHEGGLKKKKKAPRTGTTGERGRRRRRGSQPDFRTGRSAR